MARVRIRTALLVLGGTVALSAIGGYGLSRANGTGDEADDSVSVAEAGIYDEPQTLPTAPQLSGDQLPEVTLVDLDGDEIDTAALTGQPMVINFWFSTCAPCAKELPDFAAVHAELGDAVRFVGVNHFDPATTAERFASERGVQYELLLDPSASLVSALEITSFPATIFVMADGTIARLRQGALDAEALRTAIDEVLSA